MQASCKQALYAAIHRAKVLRRQSSLDLKALAAQITQTDDQIAQKDVQMSDLNQQVKSIRTQQVR